MPPVIKATAIVNGDVITQTDVDQRLAFLSIASGQPIPADQIDALRKTAVHLAAQPKKKHDGENRGQGSNGNGNNGNGNNGNGNSGEKHKGK